MFVCFFLEILLPTKTSFYSQQNGEHMHRPKPHVLILILDFFSLYLFLLITNIIMLLLEQP